MQKKYVLSLYTQHGLGETRKPFFRTSSVRCLSICVRVFIRLGFFAYDDEDLTRSAQVARFSYDLCHCPIDTVDWRLRGGCLSFAGEATKKGQIHAV